MLASLMGLSPHLRGNSGRAAVNGDDVKRLGVIWRRAYAPVQDADESPPCQSRSPQLLQFPFGKGESGLTRGGVRRSGDVTSPGGVVYQVSALSVVEWWAVLGCSVIWHLWSSFGALGRPTWVRLRSPRACCA
jgi:hypothetical protein